MSKLQEIRDKITDVSIMCLDLTGIGVQNLQKVKNEILNNCTAYRLILEENEITDDKIEIVIEIIENNNTFKEISLIYNKIEGKGLIKITAALQNNYVIQYISTRNNPYSSIEIKESAKSFLYSRDLKETSFIKRISDQIYNKEIKIFDIWDNIFKRNEQCLSNTIKFVEQFNNHNNIKDDHTDLLNIDFSNIKTARLFQKIGKNVIEKTLVQNNYSNDQAKLCITKIENYILDKFFLLYGICKHFNEENIWTRLPQEITNYILSFLGSKSLLNISFLHNTAPKIDIVKHTDLNAYDYSVELNDYTSNVIGNSSDNINLDIICWLF